MVNKPEVIATDHLCFEEDTGRWRARENIKPMFRVYLPYFDKKKQQSLLALQGIPPQVKNHGLSSIDQKLAETIAAEANNRLARQQMEQMLSLQRKNY